MTRIKVCGVRRAEDVDACIALGVDLVGFNTWPGSPRYVAPEGLGPLVERARGRIEVALVVVDGAMGASFTPGAWLQLHGDQDPTPHLARGAHVIQVLRLGHGRPVPRVTASRVLVDVYDARFGGTGTTVEAAEIESVRATLPAEWMLAGGLHAANVAARMSAFRPWGVDVSSGVESSPGVKDPTKLAAFVRAVREGDANDRG